MAAMAYTAVETVETSSRPPSPPSTRSATPRLTIGPCPARLTPLIPPVNYGAVEKHTIFRSGFPQDRNVAFLEELGLSGMITLVEEEMKPEVAHFIDTHAVNHVCVPIKANKEGEIRTTLDSLCEALLYLLNPHNYPVYIHCNRGKHRTGCVIACLRKCQLWPIDEVLAEYETYAGDKARPEDKQLIRSFNPAVIFEYAKKEGLLGRFPVRKDSVMSHGPKSLAELVSWLPAHNTALIASDDDDEMEIDSDGGIEIAQRVLRANHKVESEPEAKMADVDMIEQAEEVKIPNMESNDEATGEAIQSIDPQLTNGDQYDWSEIAQPVPVSPVRARAAA